MPDVKYVKIESKSFSRYGDSEQDSASVYWTKIERRKWLTGLFFGCVMAYSTRVVMPLSIVKISNELNWNKKDQGMILASFFWGYATTQIMGGYLSDKIGGEIVLMLGAIGWALITFWTPLLLFVTYMLTYPLTYSHMLYGQDVILEEMQSVSSHALACVAFSRILCGAFQGLLSMAWLISLRYTVVESFQRKKKRRIISMSNSTTASHNETVPWSTLFRSKAFWSVIFGHLCHTNSFFILVSWIPTYFHDNFPTQNVSTSLIRQLPRKTKTGWIGNLVPYLITIPASVGGGWVADGMIRQGYSVIFVRKLMEASSMFGTALSLLILCITSSYTSSLLCLCLALGFCALHNSGISVNVQDIAPDYSGSVFGMMNTAGAIPGFVGVYLVGFILETTGQWSIVFSQTALLCILGGILFLIFGSSKPIV